MQQSREEQLRTPLLLAAPRHACSPPPLLAACAGHGITPYALPHVPSAHRVRWVRAHTLRLGMCASARRVRSVRARTLCLVT
eukprot:7213033-Prymnesium_polylepis.1